MTLFAPVTIGSLFAGVGGIELGLEWAGLGPTLWQVEINPMCRRVLARHWPDAELHEDITRVDPAALSPVELICGGFPCQDVSSAGKRVGLAGARSGLWSHFARIVAGCRPKWVLVENVRSGAKNWVDAVRGDLGRLGYASLPVPVSASDLGAPHQRARIFIIGALADAHGEHLRLQPRRRGWPSRKTSAEPAAHDGWATEPKMVRVVSRLSGRVDRERALGNSVMPQCAEVIGHVIQKLVAA